MQWRAGETGEGNSRAPRFFCIFDQWYFSTRENLQVGPFSSLDDAELELLIFLRHVDEGGIYARVSPSI